MTVLSELSIRSVKFCLFNAEFDCTIVVTSSDVIRLFPCKMRSQTSERTRLCWTTKAYCYRDVVKNINKVGLLLKGLFWVWFVQTSGMPFQRVKRRLTQLKGMIPGPLVNMIWSLCIANLSEMWSHFFKPRAWPNVHWNQWKYFHWLQLVFHQPWNCLAILDNATHVPCPVKLMFAAFRCHKNLLDAHSTCPSVLTFIWAIPRCSLAVLTHAEVPPKPSFLCLLVRIAN